MPLAQLNRSELEFLRRAIQRQQLPTPITEISLQSVGRGKLFRKLGALAHAQNISALALIDLALKGLQTGPAKQTTTPAILVWSGPNVHLSQARPTTAVVLELLQSARKSVVIAGYEFDHGAVLFAALHKAMQDHGVKVSMYLDIRRASTKNTNMDSYLAIEAFKFIDNNWPFGEPYPQLFYFPNGTAAGSQKSLHAKCIVVDDERVLVGSANFTKRGHERNIEVGVCSKDAELAEVLVAQFERLVDAGTLASLPSPAKPKQMVPEEAEVEENAEVLDSVPAVAAELQTRFDDLMLDARLWKLFADIVAHDCEAPEVGEDIEGKGGEVIGTAELSWSEMQVAILLEEQLSCRPALESAGWTCFSANELKEQCDGLWDVLERGE